MSDFYLGERVLFTHTLTRHRRWDSKRGVNVKRWDPFTYTGEPEPAPRSGLVIGVRVLSNGEASYDGDGVASYTSAHHFTAYLLAHHLRKAPVLVLPEHIQHLDRTELPL